jgi:hypothetical protein
MERVAREKDFRRQARVAGPSHVRARLPWDRVAGRMLDLFGERPITGPVAPRAGLLPLRSGAAPLA